MSFPDWGYIRCNKHHRINSSCRRLPDLLGIDTTHIYPTTDATSVRQLTGLRLHPCIETYRL
jgi:hypothetical protein